MTTDAYTLMVERIIIDSFAPVNISLDRTIRKDLAYAALENYQATLGCKKHLDYLDSAEYCIKNQLPF